MHIYGTNALREKSKMKRMRKREKKRPKSKPKMLHDG